MLFKGRRRFVSERLSLVAARDGASAVLIRRLAIIAA